MILIFILLIIVLNVEGSVEIMKESDLEEEFIDNSTKGFEELVYEDEISDSVLDS